MMHSRRAKLDFACAAAVSMSTLAGGAAFALPAFPGAEGFGAVATGGRGGSVIKVTTLAASGPGSLQAALNAPGPRIIVFDVSGVIDGDITVPHGDVTIAGQTAPGGGITIRGRLFGEYDESVENIIMRFVRVRPIYDGSSGEQFDGMQFSLNKRLIFDHVSISWGVDETVDLYEADDVTIQWSTIEESATSGHPEGEHNYGLINGPDGHRIAIHHNLFIHHKNRNPAIANGPAEVRNNVVYNVRHGFVHHNPASGKFNIVGNTYIQGPNDDLIPFFFDDEGGPGSSTLGYFLADNYIDDPGELVGVVDNPWQTPFAHPSFEYLNAPESLRADAAFDFSDAQTDYAPVTTQPVLEARDLVLEKAGAFPRDVVTRRVLEELAARGGSWGAHVPRDLMEGLTPGRPKTDTDGDGMPDDWETSHGLDPNDPNDATSEMPSGYTAIEDYINGLADELGGSSGSGSGTSSGGSGGGPSGGAGPSGAGGGPSGGPSGAGGDGFLGNNETGSGGGCSCEVARASGLGPAGALCALLVAFAARRRKRAG
jgi:pectate lyase